MQRLPIALLILNLLCSLAGAAPDTPEAFNQGLEAFQKGQFAESRTLFNDLLAKNPHEPTLLYNIGLVELNDKHPVRAMAYWRKALYITPGFAPALEGAARLSRSPEFPNKDINPFLWLFWRLPMSILLLLSWISFMGWGFIWIRHASRQKKNKPGTPWVLAMSSMILGLFLVLTAYDYHLLHENELATIMTSAPVHSSPTSEAPALFEYKEGDEVVVRRRQGDWFQVQKSATSIGWIKKNQAPIHSGS